MRRTLIALAAALCLALGTLTAAHIAVNDPRDQLELTETVLAGDPAAAAGVTVIYRTQDQDGRLSWETRFTPGGEPETDFRFAPNGIEREHDFDFTEARLETEFSWAMSGGIDLSRQMDSHNADLLLRMATDVAEHTGTGEEHTETLFLSDYCRAWPVALQAGWNFIVERYDSETNGFLADYFYLPVESGTEVEVSVTRAVSGEVTQVNADYGPDCPQIWSESVVTAEGAYLIVDVWSESGKARLECPDGPGIHFVPFEEEDMERWFNPRELRLFYPTDAQPLRLSLSEDGGKLLLYTRESGKVVLTVIDRASAEALQRLELLDMAEEDTDLVIFDRGALHLASVTSSGAFCLLQEGGSGFAAVLTGRLDREDGEQWNLTETPVLAWDGQRLIWGSSRWYYGAYLSVWTAGGLQFFAQYLPGTFRDPYARECWLTYTEAEVEPLSITLP